MANPPPKPKEKPSWTPRPGMVLNEIAALKPEYGNKVVPGGRWKVYHLKGLPYQFRQRFLEKGHSPFDIFIAFVDGGDTLIQGYAPLYWTEDKAERFHPAIKITTQAYEISTDGS
jgi:hypothetical protein